MRSDRCARAADLVLVPGWLREKAAAGLGIEISRVHCFALEGRSAGGGEAAIDYGEIKRAINFGPLDRLILFVGPLEHAAGPDLLLEAMPILLERSPNLRLAFIGGGQMFGHLERRMRDLGLGNVVRLLGHREGDQVLRLLRACEALVLPSRYRVPMDDATVELAQRHGGRW